MSKIKTSTYAALSILLALYGILPLRHAHADTTNGLQFSYAFDGNALDSVSGQSATTKNITYLSDPERGTVAKFSRASGSYATTQTQLAPTYTKSVWVKWSGSIGSANYQNLLSRSSGGTTNLNFFGLYGTTPNNAVARASNNHTKNNPILTSPVIIPQSAWVHMAVTFDGSTLTYYQNGQVAATATNVPTSDAGQIMQIGAFQNANSFDGLIDDIKLYSRALTASDVGQLYQPSNDTLPPIGNIPSPVNIAAIPGDKYVNLSWDPVLLGADYIIEYKPSASPIWNVYALTTNFSTTAKVTSLANGTNYDFRISSVQGGTRSIPGAIIASQPNFTGYDIFIISGQSNTYYGLGYDSALDASDSRIYQLGRSGSDANQAVIATEPLQHITTEPGRIGFGMSFAKNYANNNLTPTRRILLLPEGWAGQGVNQWAAPDGTMTNDIVNRTNTAMSTYTGSQIKGLLWLQGETDTGLCCTGTGITTTEYQNKFKKLTTYLERNIPGFSNATPVVLGEMVPSWFRNDAAKEQINTAISTMPNLRDKTAVASANTPTELGLNDGDNDPIHYAAGSLRQYGQRFYSAYTLATAQPNQAPQQAPQNSSYAQAGANSIAISWNEPQNTTTPTSYGIAYREFGQTAWNNVTTPNYMPTISIDSLPTNTTYEYKIRSQNNAGASDYSAISTFSLSQQPNPDISSNLKARYSFDNSLQTDSSGNGNTLTNKGVTQISDPVRGAVAHFVRSSNQWLTGPNNLTFDTNNYTLSAWVKWSGNKTGATPYSNIISRAAGGTNKYNIFGLYHTPQPNTLFISTNHPTNSQIVSSTSSLPSTNQWTHFTVTYTDGLVSVYKNGQLIQSTPNVPAPQAGQTIQIGGYSSTNGSGWDGDMDEIRAYTRALTAAEIGFLYNSTK